MSDTPRYYTLRDYLRLLREQRALIIAVTAVAAVAALLFSALQDQTYTASSSLVFEGESPDLSLIGTLAAETNTAQERASLGAKRVLSPEVLARIKRALRTSLTTDDLKGNLDSSADPTSPRVVITAEGRTGVAAARLANAAARQTQVVVNTATRSSLLAAANRLQRRLERLHSPSIATRQVYTGSISRLQSLSEVASPVTISTRASIPDSPSSPKPVRNTLIGVVLGLLLGTVIAAVRNSLDRRLRSSHEIQQELDLPVLGQVRAEALGHTGFAPNGDHGLSDIDLEAFRILRMNLDFLDVDSPMKTVVVTSALPEEGKTTVSVSLALASAVIGRRTLLVECDLRRPALAARLGLSPSPGLTDYVSGRATPQQVLQAVPLDDRLTFNGQEVDSGKNPTEHNLVCITAGSSSPYPAELLASQKFEEFVSQVSEAYEAVILDTSPLLSVVDTRELLRFADGVVLCLRSFQTTRDQAAAAKSALHHVTDRPTGVVVTGTKAHGEDYGYYYGYVSNPS